MGNYAVALDVGGTFTDVSLVDLESGRLWFTKTESTPADLSIGFVSGISKVLQLSGVAATDLRYVFHGTTVVTNAILEGKGAVTGLVTAAGFRHVLEIGRHDVPRTANMYQWRKPRRPVPASLIREVAGRIGIDGRESEPLDEAAVRAAAAFFQAQGVEAVAVTLLHSYRNPVHEQRTVALLREAMPEAQVCASSEVLPVFREYERSMLAVINAFVLPRTSRYLERLQGRLEEHAVRGHLLIMKSNGGVFSAAAAARQPVHLALSGPAAGVIGAQRSGEIAGRRNLISVDIGGTSADICLIHGGRAEVTMEGEINSLPLSIPMVDVKTIGAGGGSIARISAGGSLTVGPESAGAMPGPVSYGRGGTEPTVTDAHLVLGRLPAHLLDGEMSLDVAAARQAIRTRIAEPLGLTLEAAAEGILAIVNNNMVGAIRVVSVEKGYAPGDFSLVPFGGAGPLHGADLALLLGMSEVVIAPAPGVLSTFGLLQTDLRQDLTQTLILRGPHWDVTALQAAFDRLEAEGRAWLAAEGVAAGASQLVRTVDARYAHQGFEITVDCPAGRVTAETFAQLAKAFHTRHEQLYTYCSPEMPVELVNVRVAAVGTLPRLQTVPIAGRSHDIRHAYLYSRPVYFSAAGGYVDTPHYRRAQLGAGAVLQGPAIVEQLDSTAVILPGMSARVDDYGNLLIRTGAAAPPGQGG